MIKNYFLTFLKSTFIVVFISLIGATAAYTLGINFVGAFLLLFAIQFILFSFVADIIKNYFQEKTKQKQLDALEPLSTILECAYCNHSNLITFNPNQNERIEFTCSSCSNKNLVNIGFSVARITEPVSVPTLTGINLKDEK
jgi:hypothetical protein